MDSLIPLLFLVLIIAVILSIFSWCINDARLRGKSALLVLIAVIFFFPWGWIAWLIFRPPPIANNEPFDID